MTDRGLELREFQRRYAEAWRAHDADAIVALHTTDTRSCTHAAHTTSEGRMELRLAILDLIALFPEYRIDPGRLLFGPDHWTLESSLVSGEVEFDFVEVAVVERSLVKTRDVYFDHLQLAETMPRPYPRGSG